MEIMLQKPHGCVIFKYVVEIYDCKSTFKSWDV